MNNISIFDVMYPKFTLKKPIRLIELFAGVGSQAMAPRNLGMDFEHHRVVEFDKYAILSYNAIHGTDFPTHDITEFKGEDLGIEEVDKYDYIMTYSFPCVDLSVAGNMKGMSRDSGTRSGLLWEVERLLNETKELPQVLLMENVPQVIAEDNLEDFHEWVRFLEDKGYQNYVEKLNAKDYGVAQNRNRAFMVSILGEYSYNFPQKIKLEKTTKDYLEDEVDEKFYISNEKASQLIEQLKDGVKGSYPPEADEPMISSALSSREHRSGGWNDIVGTLCARDYKDPKVVAIKQATEKGYIECKIGGVADLSYPDSKTRRGRVQDNGDTSPTLTASETGICKIESEYRIRKLVPLEYWRLMGFTDEDFSKAEKVNSNSQLYRQAGNSIVVQVLEAIFKQMEETE